MKYFENLSSMEIVKKQYRKLAMKYHPDRNKDKEAEEIFKAINNEYEKAINIAKENELKKSKSKKEEDFIKNQYKNSSNFRNIIDKLIQLVNINIEICGTWIYINGNTYPIKDYLKEEFGAFWSKSKKCWIISPEGKNFRKTKGYKGKNMSSIRNVYGSEKIKSEGTLLLGK